MTDAISKFAELVEKGDIVDGKPIPIVFTFPELEELYLTGRIYESGNRFLAMVFERWSSGKRWYL